MTDRDDMLIAGLVEDLEPVRPMRRRSGLALALIALVLTVAAVLVLNPLRADFALGRPDALAAIAMGLFAMLGIAAMVAAVTMASPRVGNLHDGWRWALAMAALLPLTAMALAIDHPSAAWTASEPQHGLRCLAAGLGFGLLTGGTLALWLRRGAPTSPEQAGLVTGIAAGSAGIAAFSLACPFDDVMHIGLWHSATVVVSALAGRLVLPWVLRW